MYAASQIDYSAPGLQLVQGILRMTSRDDMVPTWLAAIEQFRKTRHAFTEWRASTPCPDPNLTPEDYDKACARVRKWERTDASFAVPYETAVQTLLSLPAPNIEAAIVKLQLAREALRDQDVEEIIVPILQTIEQDLHRLADEENGAEAEPN
ncbi:hypothetical protein ACFSUK_31900 [Sphingobium scionense]|uniref:Uncharacterized protein n=3 Tax=Sphingobium TaxID=165695 RepID=A0A6M4G4H6_SPHYA|nr:hypothetical protein [Sphingobium yanoikuyae]MBB4152007.1 hypothetical protein [Sphingobium scionense]QJR02145.1 hypothetical protein HH800_08020 [Sphingobium yanoikuyae]